MNQDYVLLFITLLVSITLALGGITFIGFLYMYKKRQFLHQLELADLHTRYSKSILSSKLEMQEITQQNISREIHDNIGLSMTLVKLYLNTITWENIDAIKTRVEDSINLLSRSITDMSAVTKSLNSNILFSQGLVAALQQETEHLRRINLFQLHFSVSGDPVYLDPQKELVIFRVIQEGLRNTLNHAKPGNTWLNLNYTKEGLFIKIRDDGAGFNPGELSGKAGSGIKNMNARIQ